MLIADQNKCPWMHEGNHAIPCSLVYLKQPFFYKKKLAKFHQKVNFKFQKLSDFAHFLVAKGEEEFFFI